MILVSLTYKTEADAQSSKKIEFATENLSDQLETLLQSSSHNLETVKVSVVLARMLSYVIAFFIILFLGGGGGASNPGLNLRDRETQ